jgi:hypothetical protein
VTIKKDNTSIILKVLDGNLKYGEITGGWKIGYENLYVV